MSCGALRDGVCYPPRIPSQSLIQDAQYLVGGVFLAFFQKCGLSASIT